MCKRYFDLNDDFFCIIEKKLKCNCEILQIKSGWTNFVFEARTQNKVYIFRFPRNNFFADALIKECKFSNFIRDKLTIKSSLLKLCFNKKRPYSYHEKIEGKTLSSAINILSKTEMERICKSLCEFLFELQKNKPKNALIEKTSTFLDDLSFVCGDYYNLNKHKHLKMLEQGSNFLCHGDFNPGNIILNDKNEVVAVLDFAFVSYSSKILDLSRLSSRMPYDFNKILLKEYEKKFKCKIDVESLNMLIEMWSYVEKKYKRYIRKFHKDIVLPE